jgi:hypothetical protein
MSLFPRITLVALVDNRGNKYASIFKENSNSITTELMQTYLANILDKED